MKPIRLEPIKLTTSWAGTRLSKIRGYDASESIGIVREVCAYHNSESIIKSHEFHGRKITDLISEFHQEVMGNNIKDNQLIRVAYIDSTDQLSVQVHPNAQIAEEIGDFEKTETWYVVDCDEDSYVIAGSKTTDKEIIKKAAIDGSIESHLKKVSVKKGDVITIPAGMIHACGANMLVIEIGSYGGVTYRIYDYNSDRELHLEEGLYATDLNLEPLHVTCGEYDGLPAIIEAASLDGLYNISIMDVVDELTVAGNGVYNIFINVYGSLEVQIGPEIYPLPYLDTILIPASIDSIKIVGRGRVIRTNKNLK